MENEITNESKKESRKPYGKPAIIHELDLEVRAGSPNSLLDPLNMQEFGN